MDFLNSIQYLLKESPLPIIATALSVTLGLCLSFIAKTYKTIDLHEKSITQKNISRLIDLQKTVPSTSPVHTQISQGIELEAFRLHTGIKTSPAKMLFLINLNNDGLWNNAQIKRLSQYIRIVPGQTEPAIVIGRLDYIGAIFSLLSSLACLCLGIFYVIFFYIQPTPFLWTIGIFFFFVMTGVARLFISDWVSYSIAKSVRKHLKLKAESIDRRKKIAPID